MTTKMIKSAGALMATAVLPACSSAPAQEQLNVIYILADDLGYGDLSCTGQKFFETPNIDRLAAEGMLFTEHYAGCAVSAPSRSCLMTGQHTGHTWIRGNKEIKDGEGQAPLPAGTYTMARMFQDAGYVTGAFGKWGLGYPGSEGAPEKMGFDSFFGYNCQREAHRYYPEHLWNNGEKVMLEKNVDGKCGEYAPDLIQSKALEFIRENKDTPFFLFLPYTLPHAEITVPEDEIIRNFRGKFQEKPFIGNDYGPETDPAGYCSQSEPHAAFAAMVTRLDRYVGQIVETLEQHGIAERTLIVFTSDNGPHNEGGADPEYFCSSGNFRGMKRDLYEGGIRLPMIVRAPGTVPQGVKSDLQIAMWDMLPTFADFAGTQLPEDTQIDGISFYPAFCGRYGEQKEHPFLYWEFHEYGGKIAVRMGKWKGIIQNFTKDPEARYELYDLSKDIHEDHNVAEEHPEIVEQIRQIVHREHTESTIFRFNNKSSYL